MTLRALLELSRGTLERYGDRARASHRKLARAVGDSERRYGGENDPAAHPRAYASYEKKHKKMVARETSIRRANDRLVGHPGTLDYHWGRPKPSRRTKSGQHVAYHQESVRVAHSSRHFIDVEHQGPRGGHESRGVASRATHLHDPRERGRIATIERGLSSHGATWHRGTHAFEVHPTRVDSLKSHLTRHGVPFKHFTEDRVDEMSYRLLDRYVRRAEGDPRRAQGLARARVRLDLKRINFRDPMREDAAGAPVVDADKQARALRLKRLLAMASQAQQGIGDQTKRPVREALAEARTRADQYKATKRSYLEAKKIKHSHGRGLSSFKTKKK